MRDDDQQCVCLMVGLSRLDGIEQVVWTDVLRGVIGDSLTHCRKA